VRLSREAYAARADAVCREFGPRIGAVAEPRRLGEAVGFADRVLGPAREEVEKLGALRPPEALDEQAERWLAALDGALDGLAELRSQARTGEAVGAVRAAGRVAARADEAAELARGLGLRACAGTGSLAGAVPDPSRLLPEGVVAVVGDEAIERAELDALLRQAARAYGATGRAFPKEGLPEYRALVANALRYLVQQAQLEQKAKELGVEVSEQQVEERLRQIKRGSFGGSERRYLAALREQGLTDRQVRGSIRAQLLSQALFAKVTEGVAVSGAELEEYYDTHREQFTQPETREVRHIVVKRKGLAEEIYRRLEAGADFPALAGKYSQDASRSVGGRLTVTRGQTLAPVGRVAFALKTGEISKPVRTIYGWHVIQALAPARPGRSTPFDQVEESIRRHLLERKQDEAYAKWLEQTEKEFAPTVVYAEGYAP